MTDVAVLVPMLHRPHRIVPLLESLRATAPDACVLFICSPIDPEVRHTIDQLGEERITVDGPFSGDYARKINAGYRHTTEPLLFCGADDLAFHPGWLEAATAMLEPGIGVVGTNDLGSPRVMRGEHSTHSLVTRAYADEFGTIDEPGKVLHEGYEHEWVDDELVGTAKARGAWAFAADSYVEHLHPAWHKAPTDELYQRFPRRMRTGRALFTERQPLWV